MLPVTFLGVLVLTSGCFAIIFDDDIFPLNLHYCKRNEDNYSTCFLNAIQGSWPIFVRGIRTFESPSLDPLDIEEIEHNLKVGQLHSDMVWKDIKFFGLANAKFLTVNPRFTADRIKLDFDVEIPKILINGNYKASGVYNFFFNVRGAGKFNITMEHATAKWTVEGRIENDRWIIEHFQNDMEVKGMKVQFGDLFNGNHRLNNIARSMINQRWAIYFQNLKPTITEVSNALMVNILNRDIFSKVAVSKIFPR